MKGQLILAEHATVHPDGTISMLRAGLGVLRGAALPMPFQGTLVVRVVGELGDQGSHVLDLRCMNMDGKLVLPPISGGFDIPASGGSANLLFGLQIAFQEAGRLSWCLRIDQHIADELPFSIEVVPALPRREG